MTKFVGVHGGAPNIVQLRIKKYPPQKKELLHFHLDKRSYEFKVKNRFNFYAGRYKLLRS